LTISIIKLKHIAILGITLEKHFNDQTDEARAKLVELCVQIDIHEYII